MVSSTRTKGIKEINKKVKKMIKMNTIRKIDKK
jgi:hypothetical protein